MNNNKTFSFITQYLKTIKNFNMYINLSKICNLQTKTNTVTTPITTEVALSLSKIQFFSIFNKRLYYYILPRSQSLLVHPLKQSHV